ncbi:hypothetical protein D3C76_1104790 [compost metagenome]
METNLYMIQYNDLSNVIYEFADDELKMLTECLQMQHVAIIPRVGVFVTTDIRSIILQHPAPEQEENPSYDPDLSDHDREWLEAMKLAERLHEEEDDESDYKGGTMV